MEGSGFGYVPFACLLGGSAEEVVDGGVFGGGDGAQDVGDADGGGVGVEAEAAAVVAGESDVAVEGNVESVGEAVVFGDVVACDDGGFAVAGGAVDLLVADGELLVGVGLEGDACGESRRRGRPGSGREGRARCRFLLTVRLTRVVESPPPSLEVGSDAAVGALEVIADVEGDAAGGEAVGFVSGGRRYEAGELVLEEARDELSVEAEDEVTEFGAPWLTSRASGLGWVERLSARR